MWLKEALKTHLVLKVADPRKPFILQTDAYGLGAMLNQEDENREHSAGYASWKLLQERNYSMEKECLAVVWALSYFISYVYPEGWIVMVQTDYQPLTWLQKMINANQCLIQWTLALQSY